MQTVMQPVVNCPIASPAGSYMAGEDRLHSDPISRFVSGLYSNSSFSFGGSFRADRTEAEYRQILGLNPSNPLPVGACVLDVAAGRTEISPTALGIGEGTVIRSDASIYSSAQVRANFLNLPFEDQTFDETWALCALLYADMHLPESVTDKINFVAATLGLSQYLLYRNIRQILGLVAIGEWLRVTKTNGRVRIGSEVHHFHQGEGLKAFIGFLQTFPSSESIRIAGHETTNGNYCAFFLTRLSGYQPYKFHSYLLEQYRRVIPPQFLQVLENRTDTA